MSSLARARWLRQNATEAEKKLWTRLRRQQLEAAHFRRQVPIGPFVVDFACKRRKLIVELDGGQHAQQTERDTLRTTFLEARGYAVMRFWNNEVFENLEGVVETIAVTLQHRRPPPPRPSPESGEGAGGGSPLFEFAGLPPGEIVGHVGAGFHAE
ncbi:MAG: endonuclease domain-containing protein, partial [Alphaproteobacteria bacterium]|nr:endonuclease domain-containing protein [Alphaproteobacteria bacterium]